MIIKYIDLVNYNVAMELDVGYKVVVVLFGIFFFNFFIFLGVCGLGARLIVRFLFVVFHSTCDRSPGCSGATVAPPSSPRCAHIWKHPVEPTEPSVRQRPLCCFFCCSYQHFCFFFEQKNVLKLVQSKPKHYIYLASL